jgi:hypothetical protein
MSRHVYPRAAAAADLGRAGLGCALALTPLAAASPPPAVVAALLAILAIFAVMGLRGVLLLFTHIELETGGVSASDVLGRGAAARKLPWRDLRRVRLAYYSTRRDGRSGWLQLTLESAGGSAGDSAGRARLRVDSRLEGFRQLALAAAQAAIANRLALDPPTRSNFEALGIALDDGPAMPGPAP